MKVLILFLGLLLLTGCVKYIPYNNCSIIVQNCSIPFEVNTTNGYYVGSVTGTYLNCSKIR